MKKWIWIFISLLIIVCSGIYLLVPAVITLSRTETVAANAEEVYRLFSDAGQRNKWLNSGSEGQKDSVHAGATRAAQFQFTPAPNQSVLVESGFFGEKQKSTIVIAAKGLDSAVLIWQTSMEAGNSPFSRIAAFTNARALKEKYSDLLSSFKNFVASPVNVYSFPIIVSKVTDTLLIAIRRIVPVPPSAADIYSMVQQLENYAAANKAAPTNAPMLNISRLDSSRYQCTVALPLNKALADSGNIYFNRMIPGRILIETVQGGPATIAFAYLRLADYYRQHQLTSPALSFESLVTHRVQETDTSRWITKIYYPIF